jgi:hypothetical protein
MSEAPHSAPIGILEIGDDAPHNPARDSHMGFAIKSTELGDHDRERLAERFRLLRAALLPVGEHVSPEDTLEDLFKKRVTLRNAGKGRSDPKTIALNKRLTYLCRLVEAEAALRALPGSEPSMFQQGVRVLRDLTIPRVTAEMTICGALPPFGSILAGKLVASMAGHPQVRAFTNRDFGFITSSIFDTDKLEELLPNYGVLIVTTKGLYPGHSAQYNKVLIPVEDGKHLGLRKLGDTSGQTTSHISIATSKLAAQYTELAGGNVVSSLYGSGGAKRQRVITGAALQLGLPSELVHAYISRPVYGVNFVSNLDQVVIFNDPPIWKVEPTSSMPSDASFCERAIELWRTKWGSRAQERVE